MAHPPEFDHLKDIFQAGLNRADPYQMVIDTVRLEGDQLHLRTDTGPLEVDLAQFDRIVILGWGKASARMAHALETILGDRISEGLVVTAYGHTASLNRVKLWQAGHPVPDENSLRAGEALKKHAIAAGERTLVINLISGGGSAFVECLV